MRCFAEMKDPLTINSRVLGYVEKLDKIVELLCLGTLLDVISNLTPLMGLTWKIKPTPTMIVPYQRIGDKGWSTLWTTAGTWSAFRIRTIAWLGRFAWSSRHELKRQDHSCQHQLIRRSRFEKPDHWAMDHGRLVVQSSNQPRLDSQ